MATGDNYMSLLVDVIDMTTKEVAGTYGFDCSTDGLNEVDFYGLQVPYHISAISVGIAGTVVNSNEGTVSTLRYYADEEFTQGIENIENSQIENSAVFNLQGQRVNKAQKGVYIINNKKVVVK